MSSESTGGDKLEPRAARATAQRTVLVPLESPIDARAVLPVARVLHELEGAALHILHVCDPPLPPSELPSAVGLRPDQLRDALLTQRSGPPAAGVLRLASELGEPLIVMGSRAGTPSGGAGLGPVAEEVLRWAPCPIVLVPPERGPAPWALRRVLMPHDGVPSTTIACRTGIRLAHESDAELDILHVATADAPHPVEPGTFTAPRYVDQPQHSWPEWMSELLDRIQYLCHIAPRVKTRIALGRGRPGVEIVRFSREHATDLIALAWHGRLGGGRSATMMEVVRDASCPVLVVRVRR